MELMAALTDWLSLLAVAISSGGAIYAWITTRSKANGAEIEKIKETLRGQGDRLTSVEGELRHMPAKDDVTELKLTIAELKGSVAVFGEALGGVQRTVSRIDTYLRKVPDA